VVMGECYLLKGVVMSISTENMIRRRKGIIGKCYKKKEIVLQHGAYQYPIAVQNPKILVVQ